MEGNKNLCFVVQTFPSAKKGYQLEFGKMMSAALKMCFSHSGVRILGMMKMCIEPCCLMRAFINFSRAICAAAGGGVQMNVPGNVSNCQNP
jgi:hypothetical protein